MPALRFRDRFSSPPVARKSPASKSARPSLPVVTVVSTLLLRATSASFTPDSGRASL